HRRIDSLDVSHSDCFESSQIGAIQRTRATVEKITHGVGRQIKVAEIAHVVEAHTWLYREALLKGVAPSQLQVNAAKPAKVHLARYRRWQRLRDSTDCLQLT